MQIQVDFREFKNHPLIIKALEENGKNTVESVSLSVGDYFCYPVLVEAKVTLADFVGSVQDGRIFQQVQDLKYNQKQDPNIKPFILVAGDIADIFHLTKVVIENGVKKVVPIQINPSSLIAAWASLCVQGIPVIFMGNEWFFTKGMIYLFEKFSDGKDRTYTPVRLPTTNNDNVLTNYMSIEGINEKLAPRVREKFPIPRNFYNATVDELMTVDGIGKITSEKLVKFFKGE